MRPRVPWRGQPPARILTGKDQESPFKLAHFSCLRFTQIFKLFNIKKRRNGQTVIKKLAAFTKIFQSGFNRFGIFDGIADFFQLLLISLLSLQKPAITAHCFFIAVAGDFFKGFVGIDNRIIFLARIGKGNFQVQIKLRSDDQKT